MSNDLVFKPTAVAPPQPTVEQMKAELRALGPITPSLQAVITAIVNRELDLLTESDWFIDFIDERIKAVVELNDELERTSDPD